MYSQGLEERAILDCFTSKIGTSTIGRFLDIGAYDAKMLSNTRALYELGWSGVMFEPAPEPFIGLLREYGSDARIQIVCSAVGLHPGIVKLHATADALSTTSDEQRAKTEAKGYKFHSTFLIQQMTPAEIFARFGQFDFVSIDVEGGSADLFVKMLESVAASYLPKCVCVEHDGKFGNLEIIADRHGYSKVMRNGENLVLVRR